MRKVLLGIALSCLVLAGVGGASTTCAGEATPLYQVEDLGALAGDSASVAMGINEFGDVVGWSFGPAGTRAFLFTDATGMAALPTLAGRPTTYARAINDAGTVFGTASRGGTDIGHAVRWQSGIAQDLGTLGTGTFSEARGVNAAGVAVGYSYSNSGSLLGIHAFRHDDVLGLVDLTPAADDAHAEAINDFDQVAGWRNGRAFRLTGSTFTDLGVSATFARSFGYAINGFGTVAGHVRTASGNSERIFRYTDGQDMVLIGGNGAFNRAYGINDAGDVVGEGRPVIGLKQGFLYTDANGMQGLNALIDPSAGWFILGAGDINAAGQIAGWASGPQGQRAVRLSPGVGNPPAAPSALTGAILSSSRIRLNWTDNSANETGFTMQRALGSRGRFKVLAQVGANATTYIDTTVTAGKIYRYRVQAYNRAGESPWSNTIRLQPRSGG